MTSKSRDKAPSVRMLRVGETMRHAIADMLMRGDIHDSALTGTPVTVTEVRLSPDLRHATAFIMPLGGSAADLVQAALNRQAPHIQGQIGRHVRMKFTPRLHFKLDASFDEAARVDALLADPRVRRDTGPERAD